MEPKKLKKFWDKVFHDYLIIDFSYLSRNEFRGVLKDLRKGKVEVVEIDWTTQKVTIK